MESCLFLLLLCVDDWDCSLRDASVDRAPLARTAGSIAADRARRREERFGTTERAPLPRGPLRAKPAADSGPIKHGSNTGEVVITTQRLLSRVMQLINH